MPSLRRPFNPSGLVIYLTDFGLQDDYVGQMHLNLLGYAPRARIVDLCHQVSPGSIRSASFLLVHDLPYIPPGAVVVCVVDPGVGTDRSIVALQSDANIFLAPDNGLLGPVQNVMEQSQAYRAILPEALRKDASMTFHGRDLFTPLAAHLATNPMALQEHFESVQNIQTCAIDPKESANGWEGEVMWIDRFGNLVTNLFLQQPDDWSVRGGKDTLRRVNTFGEGEPDEIVWLIGSRGTVELVVNKDSAQRLAGLGVGDTVIAERKDSSFHK